MTSTRDNAVLLPSNRQQKGNRLLLGIGFAILLVTLPVLPLRFLGIPGPDFSPDLTHLAQGWHDLLNKLNIVSSDSAHPPRTKKIDAALNGPRAQLDDVSVLDTSEQRLLNQIAHSPEDPGAYNQLGLIYASSGEYDKAVANLQKAIELARTRIAQMTQSERQMRAQGLANKASSCVLERSRICVELSAAHSLLARVYDQLGQHDRVVAQLEQLNNDVVFGGSTSAPAKTSPGPTAYGAAVAASHKLSPAVLRLLARAEAMMQARRLAEASDQYKQVLQLDPMAGIAYQRLGSIAAMNGNYYLAVQNLETAAHLDASDPKVHIHLGSAYQSEGDNELAIEQYEKALAIDPRSAEAALALGNLLCGAGQYKPAEEAFEKLTKLTPDSAMAHSSLATARSMGGDYKGAIGEFQKSLMLEPDVASSHYGLGLAFLHNNNYPASIREMKRALAINPSLTDAQAKIEIAYKKAGVTSMAGFHLN